jgi:integrase/recombinase XerD
MKTSLTLSLDKRRMRSDDSFPIIIRLSHCQRTTSIATGYYVQEIHWDQRKKVVKKAHKGLQSVVELNQELRKKMTSANETILKLRQSGELEYLSLKQLKERILGIRNQESYIAFANAKVKELEDSQRYGTARSYRGLIQALLKFTAKKDIKFREINYNFILRFEKNHLRKGNGLNGLSAYLRTLRAIYNKGIKEGLVEREAYPFYNYTIKSTPTEKRAIDIKYIQRILELELEKGTNLFHYRNYFISSYLMYGISFIDMAFLKMENIVDGRIKFRRRKTSKPYDIKITDQLAEILDYYILNKKRSDFIFPIISRTTLKEQEKDILWARPRYNKGLKKIAELCGIQQRLTSYVSRHSFATQAMMKDIPLHAISAMLGHSKLSTTQIYLKSLPSNVLDAYNKEISLLV